MGPVAPSRGDKVEYQPPAIIAIITFATFLPVLWNEFLGWDDKRDLVNNQNFRGLGWTQLRWMFSLRSELNDHYYPLTWLTHALDYVIWGGLNPVGSHLTNLVLHTASAVIFYFICKRLLALALPGSNWDESSLIIGAMFGALLWAIHPLRVESVAWAVERKDVLSGFFFLLAILFYLKSKAGASWRWMGAVFLCYLAALLSKAIAVTLPPVLILLDIYVLKRLPPNPRQWFTPASRPVLYEKIPFLLMGALFALVSWWGESQVPAEIFPISRRMAQALLAPSWYLWKTLIPFNLSPLYETPPAFSLLDWWVITGMAITLAVTILFYCLRTRWPWACWLSTLAVLAPVSGIVQTGGHEKFFVADRYTYLPFWGWAVLGGGVLLCLLRRTPVKTRRQRRRGDAVQRPFALPATAAAIVLLSALALLTSNQTKVWRNDETLWRQMLKVDPGSSYAHYNFGIFLAEQGNHAEAISHYYQALRIRPNGNDRKVTRDFIHVLWCHTQLAGSLAIEGQWSESEEHFQQALRLVRNAKSDSDYQQRRPERQRILSEEEFIRLYRQHLAGARALRQAQAR
jgi:protein O-mannosyl-transferase